MIIAGPALAKSQTALLPDEETDQTNQMIDDMFGMGQFDDSRTQTLDPDKGSNVQRKPKFLMSKLSNLMRDTKSSANRNRNRGQITGIFGQTQAVGGPGQSFLSNEDPPPAPPTIRKSPSKTGAKPHSPKRRQQSPVQKQRPGMARSTQNLQGIINLKATPTKFD
jgi:hypothetical protein